MDTNIHNNMRKYGVPIMWAVQGIFLVVGLFGQITQNTHPFFIVCFILMFLWTVPLSIVQERYKIAQVKIVDTKGNFIKYE